MTLEDRRCGRRADFKRFQRIAIVAILCLAPIAALEASVTDGLFSITLARGYFREVMRASLNAMPDTERAAFIVGKGDGSLSCQLWPTMSLYHREVFHGALPPGTLAIIHTHPDSSPRPSLADQFEADRLGIPIYVLTRRDVFKAEPGRSLPTAVVRRESWLDDGDSAAAIRCVR
jgi:hypothetical protein